MQAWGWQLSARRNALLAAGIGLPLAILLLYWTIDSDQSQQPGGVIVDRARDVGDVANHTGTLPLPNAAKLNPTAQSTIKNLETSAHSSPEAAAQLGAIISLCTFTKGDEKGNRRKDRFDDARWKPWIDACASVDVPGLMDASTNWATPHGPAWDALQQATALGEDTHSLQRRDHVALEIISQSDDPELVAQAANLYFDIERLRAWSRDLPRSFAEGDASGFRTDLALMLACRAGRDCSGSSVHVVAECAVTSMCYPGMPMHEVIALRRPPQEMALLRKFEQRVLALRK